MGLGLEVASGGHWCLRRPMTESARPHLVTVRVRVGVGVGLRVRVRIGGGVRVGVRVGVTVRLHPLGRTW